MLESKKIQELLVSETGLRRDTIARCYEGCLNIHQAPRSNGHAFQGVLLMKLRVSVAALICLYGAEAGAREFDLSLSNDTAMILFATPINYSGSGHTDVNAGLMYTESNDVMIMGGIEMMGEAGSHAPGLHFGVGVKGYGVALDSGADVGSVAIGGKGWYVPPKLSRMGLVGQIYFGPDITTFGDADRFWEVSGRIEYEVIPEAAIYVGYREIETRLKTGMDVALDKGWHIGLRMSF